MAAIGVIRACELRGNQILDSHVAGDLFYLWSRCNSKLNRVKGRRTGICIGMSQEQSWAVRCKAALSSQNGGRASRGCVGGPRRCYPRRTGPCSRLVHVHHVVQFVRRRDCLCRHMGGLLCPRCGRSHAMYIEQHVERGAGTALIEQNIESAAFSASLAHQTTRTSQ
jgi:hypothetical protein